MIPFELKLLSKQGIEYKCLYDQEDQDLVSQFSWTINPKGYAVTWDRERKRNILMHRLVMDVLDQPEIAIDHRFHNPLDNRKSMLRKASHKENRRNSSKEKNCTSTYKGSYFEKERGLFHAQIGFATETGTKVLNLGRYQDERLAGKAYDRKALELFGSFACVNFPSSHEAMQLQFPWIN